MTDDTERSEEPERSVEADELMKAKSEEQRREVMKSPTEKPRHEEMAPGEERAG